MAILQNFRDLITGAKLRASAQFPQAPFAGRLQNLPIIAGPEGFPKPQIQNLPITTKNGELPKPNIVPLGTVQPPPNIDPTTGFNYGGPVVSPTSTNVFGQPSVPPAQPAQPDLTGQLASIASGLQGVQSGLQAQPQQEEIARRRAEDELLYGLQISPEEEQAQKQLNALIQSRELGLRGIEEKPIAMEFITGQKAALERRAATQSIPLTQNLALLQARRQAASDVAKTKLDITEKRAERAKPDEEKVTDFTDAEGNKIVVYRDKKTGTIRNVNVGKGVPESTQSERQAQMRTQAFTVARPLLNAARTANGFVNRNTYLKLRADYAEAIGDVKEFDDVFSPMLSPEDRKELFKSPSFTSDVIANLFGS